MRLNNAPEKYCRARGIRSTDGKPLGARRKRREEKEGERR
jgi:hypothetical protein